MIVITKGEENAGRIKEWASLRDLLKYLDAKYEQTIFVKGQSLTLYSGTELVRFEMVDNTKETQ